MFECFWKVSRGRFFRIFWESFRFYKNVVCDLRIYHFLNIQGGMLIYKIHLEGLRDDFPLPWVAWMISRRSMISMMYIYIYIFRYTYTHIYIYTHTYVDYIYIL